MQSTTWADIQEALTVEAATATPILIEQLRQGCPTLSRFRDPLAMLFWLEDPGSCQAQRDVAYRELIQLAKSGEAISQLAVSLTLLGLWPALDHVYQRLQGLLRDPDQRAQLVAGLAVVEIRDLQLDRVNKVAATLVANVLRNAKTELRQIAREQAIQTGEGDLDLIADSEDPTEHSVGRSGLELVLEHAASEIGQPNADLLRSAFVDDRPHAETAKLFGMTASQVRQRVSRSLRKLKDNPRFLSQIQKSAACTQVEATEWLSRRRRHE